MNDVTVESSATQPEQSGVEQSEAAAVQETTAVAEEATQEPKTVPYDRFKEVNDKYKATEATLEALNQKIASMETRLTPQEQAVDPNLQAAKEQLKALGFVSKEDVERTLNQKEEDAKLERELTRLEDKFNGTDGLPKFNRKEVIDYAISKGLPDPEIAFKVMKEKEILDWQIKEAITKSKGIKTEASDGSGSSQSGTTDEDLKEGIRQGDKNALRTYLKRLTKV